MFLCWLKIAGNMPLPLTCSNASLVLPNTHPCQYAAQISSDIAESDMLNLLKACIFCKGGCKMPKRRIYIYIYISISYCAVLVAISASSSRTFSAVNVITSALENNTSSPLKSGFHALHAASPCFVIFTLLGK